MAQRLRARPVPPGRPAWDADRHGSSLARAAGRPGAARPAYWFPLALFGVIVALSVPLYALQLSTAPMASGWASYAPLTRTVFWSSAHSSFSALLSPDGGPLGVAEGWYWAAALAAVFLVTTVWYRRAGRGGLAQVT